MGVSEKTIRNDLDTMEPVLRQYHLALHKKPGVGIEIGGDTRAKQYYMEHLEQVEGPAYTTQERRNNILLRLLSSARPILIKELAQDYFVSRGTITEDIKELNDYLEPYNQSIKNIKTVGLVVEGDERDKRRVLSELFPVRLKVHPGEGQRNWYEILARDEMLADISAKLQVDILKLIPILEEAQNRLGYIFSTEAFTNLLIHLAIAIRRSQTGNLMELTPDLKDNFQGNEEMLAIAEETAQKIEEQFQIHFQEAEIYYILIHFLGARAIKSEVDLGFKLSLEQKEQEEAILHFVKQVQYELNLYLEKDIHLINNLILHLKPTINRLRYNLTLENPLTEEIITKYQNIYEAVLKKIPILNEAFGITFPVDELAYITLHFAAAIERLDRPIRTLVVCSSGIGMSQLMVAQIEKSFKNIEVIDSVSLLDVPKYRDKNIELIISTINVGPIEGIQTVLVNPLLNSFDIANIRKAISGEQAALENVALLNQCFIWEIAEKLTKEEVLSLLNTELLKRDKVSMNYLTSLKEREKVGSTYIGHGVAVPHGAVNEVHASCLQILKLRHKVLWDGENEVNFILNFVAKQQDAKVFSILFRNIGKKIDDEAFWGRLVEETDKETLLSLLKEELIYADNE